MIHARGLVQTFKTKQGRKKVEVRAVDGVDLDVAEGEVVGFLGPNGAGKTTTLRMLTTLLRPTAGTATVAGYDVVKRVRAGTPQHRLRLPGRRRLLRRPGRRRGRRPRDALRAQPRAGDRSAGSELFEQLDLPGLWNRTPKQMSGGQKRRLDIVMGLIHDPTLVFLDEPTTGLDPQARANLWEHIADLRTRARRDGLPDHALPRRGRRAQRPDHGHRPGPDRRQRHRREPQGRRSPATWSTSRWPTPDRVADAATALGADRGRTSRSTASTCRGRVPARRRAVPGLLRDLDRAGIDARLDRGAPPDPRRRLPDPDRPLAARRRDRRESPDDRPVLEGADQ